MMENFPSFCLPFRIKYNMDLSSEPVTILIEALL